MSNDNHSRGDGTACFTPCDPDCDAICHEDHVAGHKKAHWPYDCPAADRYGWGGSDFIAAAVKRLRSERDEAREQLAAANARAETAQARLAEIGEPETEWGHRVLGDDGHRGDDVQQVDEAAARAAVQYLNTRMLPSGSHAVLICRETRFSATPWHVAPDDAADGHSATQTSAQ